MLTLLHLLAKEREVPNTLDIFVRPLLLTTVRPILHLLPKKVEVKGLLVHPSNQESANTCLYYNCGMFPSNQPNPDVTLNKNQICHGLPVMPPLRMHADKGLDTNACLPLERV